MNDIELHSTICMWSQSIIAALDAESEQAGSLVDELTEMRAALARAKGDAFDDVQEQLDATLGKAGGVRRDVEQGVLARNRQAAPCHEEHLAKVPRHRHLGGGGHTRRRGARQREVLYRTFIGAYEVG